MLNRDEVAKNFANRKPNPRQGKVAWEASNFFCEDDIIYSYGGHFPVAKYLGEHPKYGRLFILNDDGYSNSTAAHKSTARKYCKGPYVSRSKLGEFFRFTEIELKHIYLWRKSVRDFLWQDQETGKFYSNYISHGSYDDSTHGRYFTDEYKLPRCGKFKAYRKQDNPRYHSGQMTVDEVLVLKIDRKYLLCANSTVVELTRKPKSISDALKMKKGKSPEIELELGKIMDDYAKKFDDTMESVYKTP